MCFEKFSSWEYCDTSTIIALLNYIDSSRSELWRVWPVKWKPCGVGTCMQTRFSLA